MNRDLEPYLPDERWFRFAPRGIHGAPHTARVLVWASVLADQLAGPDALRRDELLWAASVHDVGRENDGIDAGHGARSAAWVSTRLPNERPATSLLDLPFVAELCQWHETSDHQIPCLTLELVILKDADALDRCRIRDLDPERLRLASSRRLVEPAVALERATNRYGTTTAGDVLAAASRLWPGWAAASARDRDWAPQRPD